MDNIFNIEEASDFKILVVEDEPKLRELFARILQYEGYHIVTASNGLEGLNILKNEKKISLVITDIEMPIMNGIVFLREAKKIRPDLKTIVTTCSDEIKGLMPNLILAKPFRIDEFVESVKLYI